MPSNAIISSPAFVRLYVAARVDPASDATNIAAANLAATAGAALRAGVRRVRVASIPQAQVRRLYNLVFILDEYGLALRTIAEREGVAGVFIERKAERRSEFEGATVTARRLEPSEAGEGVAA